MGIENEPQLAQTGIRSYSMSDVTVAPSPDTPTAPAQAEVPINEAPINSTNPVGSQAPEKPDHASERKAAIQKAFERAKDPDKARTEQRPVPKAAEAKKGHNQPPEDTPAEKLDLKRRPSDQPRSDRGTFAPKAKAADEEDRLAHEPAMAARGTPGAQGSVRVLPEHAPYREPPPRMADHAKADWASAPESVRGEVYRMNAEFDGAYQRYRGDHEVMNTIRPYHELAHKHGTTLDRALNNYVSMEQKLRADPIGGLDLIVHNLRLTDPQTGKQVNLRDVAYHVLSQSPDQLKAVQQGNTQQAQNQQLGALHQELQGLKNELYQMHNQQRFTWTRSAVDQFADSHPRFDELADLIEREISLGFDIDSAYKRAVLLKPGPAAQTGKTNPSAQTRTVDRSISGAPATGPSNGTGKRNGATPSRRDAIREAMANVR